LLSDVINVITSSSVTDVFLLLHESLFPLSVPCRGLVSITSAGIISGGITSAGITSGGITSAGITSAGITSTVISSHGITHG